MFLFPQSEDISRGLPQGDRLWGTGDIHFGERILFRKRRKGEYLRVKKYIQMIHVLVEVVRNINIVVESRDVTW